MIHIVDDEAVLREVLALIFASLGYQTKVFSSPSAYLKFMASDAYSSPKVLFTDLKMPGGITGYELIGQVQASHPDQRCVVMSGFDSEPSAYKNLACMYLQKPFFADKIRAVMAELKACDENGACQLAVHADCDVDDRALFCLQGWFCPHNMEESKR
ncbi:MAG: response regulator [Mariprofundus sp.]|nr:response regulator [Mariprofundus sp.]